MFEKFVSVLKSAGYSVSYGCCSVRNSEWHRLALVSSSLHRDGRNRASPSDPP